MSKVITIRTVNNFFKKGVLDIANIKFIIGERNEEFPQQFYAKYMRLLYRFQIACRIDEHRILVPSKLPEGKPANADKDIDIKALLKRYHFFTCLPYGFWSRFMSRLLLLMKEMLSPCTPRNDFDKQTNKNSILEESTDQTDNISSAALSDFISSYRAEDEPTTPTTPTINAPNAPGVVYVNTINTHTFERFMSQDDVIQIFPSNNSSQCSSTSVESNTISSIPNRFLTDESTSSPSMEFGSDRSYASTNNSKFESADHSRSPDDNDIVINHLSGTQSEQCVERHVSDLSINTIVNNDKKENSAVSDNSNKSSITGGENDVKDVGALVPYSSSGITHGEVIVHENHGAGTDDGVLISDCRVVATDGSVVTNGNIPVMDNGNVVKGSGFVNGIRVGLDYTEEGEEVDSGDVDGGKSSDVVVNGTSTDEEGGCSENVTPHSDLDEKDGLFINTCKHPSIEVPHRVIEDNPQPKARIDQQRQPFLYTQNTDEENLFTDCVDIAYLLDNKYITCWKDGVVFNHPQLYFSVQQVPSVKKDRQAIETRISRSPLGYRVLGFIVDHINTLVKEWYPGLSGNDGENAYVMQYIACPVCTRMGINPPYLFDIQTAFNRIYNSTAGDYCIPCIRSHSPQVVNVEDLCPELVFKDLHKGLQLDRLELQYEEHEDDLLGKGAYGTVYRGHYKEKRAAVKLYDFNEKNLLASALDAFHDVRQEIFILSKLRNHPHIVEFLGFSMQPKLCAVMELAEYGTLHGVLENSGRHIDRFLVFRIAQEVASGLTFMHSRNIIHRDIKPDNILLFSLGHDAHVNVKLTDFGTANFMSPSGMNFPIGTPGFMAPEVLDFGSSDEYSSKVDIFSFAMVLYEMITLHRPFHDLITAYLITEAVKKGERPIYCDVPQAFYGLLTITELMIKMWHQESVHRPVAKDVLKQLKDVSFQLLYGKRALEVPQNPRYMCFVHSVNELWVVCDDRQGKLVFCVYFLKWLLIFTYHPVEHTDFVLSSFY